MDSPGKQLTNIKTTNKQSGKTKNEHKQLANINGIETKRK